MPASTNNILNRYVEISVQPNKTVAKDRHSTGHFFSLMNQKQMTKAKTYGKTNGKGLMMTQDQGRASLEKFSPEIEKQCSQKWPIARDRMTCDAMETYDATEADARKE